MTTEEWRPVPGYEGVYEVSETGRVRRLAATHLHPAGFAPAQHRNVHGYVKVGLYRGGTYSLVSVHRLVALAFHPDEASDDLEVCHRDGDQTNNAASNLYWGTSSQNQADTIRHGRHRWANRTHCEKGHPYDEENTLRIDFPTFRFEAKAGSDERLEVDGVKHPTVKPIELMRWLVRLATPAGGTILEPFAGSGTTLEAALREGFTVIGIERATEYLPLIEARLSKPLQVAMFGDWEDAS